jgi:hypothetical protein
VVNDEAPTRDFGLYLGLVEAVDDPKKQGRVRVTIPGVIEPGKWALVAMPGSPFSGGLFVVPPLKSQVLVGFLQGDWTQPVVLGGFAPPAGTGGFRASLDKADLPDFATLENKDFIIVLGKKGTSAPYIDITSRGEPKVNITLDAETGAVELNGGTAVTIKAGGQVRIDAPVIALGNRPVLQNGEPL